MKKAAEGLEGQTKAKGSIIPKSYNFFTSMGLFGVIDSHVSLFLSFKAKKVKKATEGREGQTKARGSIISKF